MSYGAIYVLVVRDRVVCMGTVESSVTVKC